jgi:hypothetical protein
MNESDATQNTPQCQNCKCEFNRLEEAEVFIERFMEYKLRIKSNNKSKCRNIHKWILRHF